MSTLLTLFSRIKSGVGEAILAINALLDDSDNPLIDDSDNQLLDDS